MLQSLGEFDLATATRARHTFIGKLFFSAVIQIMRENTAHVNKTCRTVQLQQNRLERFVYREQRAFIATQLFTSDAGAQASSTIKRATVSVTSLLVVFLGLSAVDDHLKTLQAPRHVVLVELVLVKESVSG